MNDFKDCIAVGYVRVALKEEYKAKESLEITSQKKYIEDYCNKNAITLIGWYIDDGFDGLEYDRPEFNKLLNDIELGKINTVITKDMSRLGRNMIRNMEYCNNWISNNNVRYISIMENYDSKNLHKINKDFEMSK